MIRFIQQSTRDLMLRFAPGECVHLREAVARIQRGHTATLTIEVHASIFHIRSPKEIELNLRLADVDRIHREAEQLAWELEPETAQELSEKLAIAATKGYFVPAELCTLKGPRDEWVHLYGEVVGGGQPRQ
jgi:hypothetical protein